MSNYEEKKATMRLVVTPPKNIAEYAPNPKQPLQKFITEYFHILFVTRTFPLAKQVIDKVCKDFSVGTQYETRADNSIAIEYTLPPSLTSEQNIIFVTAYRLYAQVMIAEGYFPQEIAKLVNQLPFLNDSLKAVFLNPFHLSDVDDFFQMYDSYYASSRRTSPTAELRDRYNPTRLNAIKSVIPFVQKYNKNNMLVASETIIRNMPIVKVKMNNSPHIFIVFIHGMFLLNLQEGKGTFIPHQQKELPVSLGHDYKIPTDTLKLVQAIIFYMEYVRKYDDLLLATEFTKDNKSTVRHSRFMKLWGKTNNADNKMLADCFPKAYNTYPNIVVNKGNILFHNDKIGICSYNRDYPKCLVIDTKQMNNTTIATQISRVFGIPKRSALEIQHMYMLAYDLRRKV